MSIERGHASGVSSSAAPRPAGGKGAAAQAAAAGGDFLAMLAALADGLQGGDTPALATGDAALADAGAGADRRSARRTDEAARAASADGAAGFAGAGADAMAALLAAGAAIGATAGGGVGAAVGAGGAVAGVVEGAEAVAKAAAAAAAAMAQGDAAPGRAPTPGGVPGRADALAAPPDPPPPGPSAEAALATASTPSTPSAAVAAATAAALDAAARHAGAGLQAEADPAYASVFEQLKNRLAAQDAADTTTPAASRAQTAALELRQSERMLSQRSLAQALSADPAAVQAGALDALSAGTGPSRGPRGSLEAVAAGRTEGGWTAPEFTPTVQYDAGLVGVEAAASASASAGDGVPLAEQLRYWLSQGVTSAEWTVAGDADPVQVSISLQGNEASVTFRSEQAGTRELLAASVDQLRELLQRDGVVLSGVSVGAHGSGAQGQPAGSDAAPCAATPRRQAAAVAPVAAPVSSPVGRSAGGGVDLFV